MPVSDAEHAPGLVLSPVTTEQDEQDLRAVLAEPNSAISTDGPVWRSPKECLVLSTDTAVSHLLVRSKGALVGAVSWRSGHTPGFVRVELRSGRDESWDPHLIERALDAVVGILRRSAAVRRVEVIIPGYSVPFLQYLTETETFAVEGVLVDRYFLDGRYWPGLVCRVVPGLLRPSNPASATQVELLAALLRRVGRNADELAQRVGL